MNLEFLVNCVLSTSPFGPFCIMHFLLYLCLGLFSQRPIVYAFLPCLTFRPLRGNLIVNIYLTGQFEWNLISYGLHYHDLLFLLKAQCALAFLIRIFLPFFLGWGILISYYVCLLCSFTYLWGFSDHIYVTMPLYFHIVDLIHIFILWI